MLFTANKLLAKGTSCVLVCFSVWHINFHLNSSQWSGVKEFGLLSGVKKVGLKGVCLFLDELGL